jgi:glycosyltransferase involved in cell wall biosynthesis
MKIGIDAKWFFSGPISGQIMMRNLLPELIALGPEYEWHLFLDKRKKSMLFPVKAKNVHLHYVWASLNILSNFFVLPRIAKALELDGVLFQTFCPKNHSYRSLVFIHDILFENYPQFFTLKEKIYFKLVKKSCNNTDRVITSSQTVKNDLLQHGYVNGKKRVDIVPLAVGSEFKPLNSHESRFLNAAKEKYELPAQYILFTGRLNARKNIESLLLALPAINNRNISVVIVGMEDWKASKLQKILASEEINSRVKLIGAVSSKELPAIYAMAKVFCYPSFAEGFGLPPLEAMASGVPVVTSNTTSMPVVCGNAALFIDPHNPNDIAEKINELLKNNNLYEQKVKEGLTRSAQYTWKRTAEGIIKAILATLDPAC